MHHVLEGLRPDSSCLSFTTPPEEDVQYTVTCFPAREDGTIRNWTFGDLDDSAFKERLRSKVPQGITTVYAPSVVKMSGVVLPPERFTRIFPIDRGLVVRRPGFIKDSNDDMVGCDGTQIARNTAGSMTAGGCAFIIVSGLTETGEDLCLMAHAGRDSLIDMHVIKHEKSSRAHFSIVDAMVAYAARRGARTENLILRSFFALHWVAFEHRLDYPGREALHEKLVTFFNEHPYFSSALKMRYGRTPCICLSTLIQQQANTYPFKHVQTMDHVLPVDGSYAYTRHTDPEMRGERNELRNLVLGYRH